MFSGTLPFSSSTQTPYIALAPMEGLMDFHLRALLTSVGGIDHCVTEFLRVTQQVYPARVFKRICPELLNDGKTASGVPVHLQLLGSDPDLMAANAAKAADLGTPAIDLNFGCPAKTVNRSQGGAVLLQWPERLHQVAQAVRTTVPHHIPVSAKMRLGYQDKTLALENADALASAGIQWLTVHARTRSEGYKPPAHWEWIAKLKNNLSIPVLANGEIWTPEHAQQCQQESGSDVLMIGRGLVATPDLALQIKAVENGLPYTPLDWRHHLNLLPKLAEQLGHLTDKQLTDRLKQWLHYFSMRSGHIYQVFEQVKRERSVVDFLSGLDQAATALAASALNDRPTSQYEHRGF